MGMVPDLSLGFRAKLGDICTTTWSPQNTFLVVLRGVEFNEHGFQHVQGVQGQVGEPLEPVQPRGALISTLYR